MSNEKSIDRSAAELSATMAASVHKQTLHFADGSSVEIVGVPAITQAKWNPAPLVAVSDNTELQYALDRMCTPLDESRLSGATAAEDARCMKIIRDHIVDVNKKVAPQATVEPLTDEQIIEAWDDEFGVHDLEIPDNEILAFARGLLRATHPTSKAQSDRHPTEIMSVLHESCNESELAFSAKEMRTVLNLWNSERFMRTTLQERLDCRATSKADTGEQIRNAALEEAINVCNSFEICHNPEHIADAIRALKSAPHPPSRQSRQESNCENS